MPDELVKVHDVAQEYWYIGRTPCSCGGRFRKQMQMLQGRGRTPIDRLVTYRTTDEIRRFAVCLLEGREIDDLDGGVDQQKGYVSLTQGSPPLLRAFATFAEETAFLKRHVAELQNEGAALESVCLGVCRRYSF